MKRLLLFILLFNIVSLNLKSQTVFWTEAFSNGCSSNCLASAYVGPNGAWSIVNTGVNGAQPNTWFVSCAEDGCNVNGCGVGCGGGASCPVNDPSLHVGSVPNSDCGCFVCPTGDCGAAYDACDGFTFCGGSPAADKRATSPVINCTGRTSNTIAFNYIENGQGATDNATLWYFNGVSWAQIADMAKTAFCGAQGRWTAFSIALPASANNNANVRIGFRWVNDADGAGNDPSFAVDDITISGVVALPVELTQFNGVCDNGLVTLKWATSSEIQNNYFSVEKSIDVQHWSEAGRIDGKGNSNVLSDYGFKILNDEPQSYYRLKQVDFDGHYKYYDPIFIACHNPSQDLKVYPIPSAGPITVESLNGALIEDIKVYDMHGKEYLSQFQINPEGLQSVVIDLSILEPGVYYLKIRTGITWSTKQVVLIH